MNKNIALAVTASLGACYSTASFAGLSFKQVNSSDGKTTSEAQIFIEGGSMKSVVETQADNPMMPSGSYLVNNEQGMFLVNPTARTFARFDMSMMEGMTQAMNESGLMNTFEITNVTVEKTVDEPGESVQGYATHHYQFKSSWTMVMSGSPMTTDFSSVEDIWTTTELEIAAQANMPSFDQSSMPAGVKALADAQGLANVEGFPLRTVTVQSTKVNMGMRGFGAGMAQSMMNRAMGGAGGGDVTSTMEVTDIQEIDIPAETFQIPADYSETQLFQTGPALPDLNNLPGGEQPTAPPTPALPDLNNIN